MLSVKREVAVLPERRPEDCSVEDLHYPVYVLEKFAAVSTR